jgi:hypothetical protein
MAFKPFPLGPRFGAIHFIEQEIKEKEIGVALWVLPPPNGGLEVVTLPLGFRGGCFLVAKHPPPPCPTKKKKKTQQPHFKPQQPHFYLALLS